MKLQLAGTPLGNPRDASARLIQAIQEAQIIAAEDSRRFQRLCQDLSISTTAKVLSFFEGNEIERSAELLRYLKEGTSVLVLTDAGMPMVSDPGYKLVRDAIAENIQIEVIPGPSAVTTALVLSGLPTDRFIFEGFVPRTQGARESFFESLRFENRTIISFEAPHRINETLAAAASILGEDRQAVICREMTKTYEEVARGTLAELKIWADSKEILGEITMVISGAIDGAKELTEQEIVLKVQALETAGMERKEAISEVANQLKLAKRVVFDAMVNAKKLGN